MVKAKESGSTSGPLSIWHRVHGIQGVPTALYSVHTFRSHCSCFNFNMFLSDHVFSSSLMVSFGKQFLLVLKRNFSLCALQSQCPAISKDSDFYIIK